MIKLKFPIICPVCDLPLKDCFSDVEFDKIFSSRLKIENKSTMTFICYCGKETKTLNLSFAVEAENTDKGYIVDNFGIFLNINNNNSFLSCNYNRGEISPYLISLCNYSGNINDRELCGDAKIIGDDINTASLNGYKELLRFQKLLVFL